MELSGRSITLPSGATLYAKPARYEETEEFLGSFLRSVVGLPSDFTKEDGTINEASIKVVSEIVVSKVFTDKELKSAMWKCLSHFLYVKKEGSAPEKVLPLIFDNGTADRGDLADIFYECAYENFLPFLKGLYGVSSRLQDQIKTSLK